jgi:hypothetical protein
MFELMLSTRPCEGVLLINSDLCLGSPKLCLLNNHRASSSEIAGSAE